MHVVPIPGVEQSNAAGNLRRHPVETWEDMREALATHAARAAEKARRHGLIATAMQVFIHTNPHAAEPFYSAQRSFEIEPTNDSFAMIAQAVAAGRSMWRPGLRYAKAGIILPDLQLAAEAPRDLVPSADPARSEKLMATLDGLNSRFGRGTIRPGGIRPKTSWSTRANNKSPAYTTRLTDLMIALA